MTNQNIIRAKLFEVASHAQAACEKAGNIDELSKIERGCLRDFRAKVRLAIKDLRTDFPEYFK